MSSRPRRTAPAGAPGSRAGSSTFSSPLSSGTRWKNWKTKPDPPRRNRVSSRSERPSTRSPATSIVPASARSRPPEQVQERGLARARTGPTTATSSPARTSRAAPSSTRRRRADRAVGLDEAVRPDDGTPSRAGTGRS